MADPSEVAELPRMARAASWTDAFRHEIEAVCEKTNLPPPA